MFRSPNTPGLQSRRCIERQPLTQLQRTVHRNAAPQVSPIIRFLPRQKPCLAFESSGEKIAIATAEAIQVWDGQLQERVCETPIGADDGKQVYVVGLDFYPDGKRLAVKQRVYVTGSEKAPNDEYFTLDATDGEQLSTSGELNRHGIMHYGGTLQVHPFGQWLITDEVSFLTRTLTVIDAETYEQTRQLMTGGESSVDLITLSGDGTRFATKQQFDS